MRMSEDVVTRFADMFAALGAEPRLRIVRLLLAAHPDASIALMQACHPTRNVPRIFGPMLEGWRLAGLPER